MTASRIEPVQVWLDDVLSAAVLGTDRRPAPTPPDVLAAAPPDPAHETPAHETADHETAAHATAAHEIAVLDQAAMAAAAVRAGRRPTTAEPTGTAPTETLPYAPARAVELLGVLLDAPPVSRDLRIDLIGRWLDVAADRGCLVPARFLPPLIAMSGVQQRLRPSLHRAWGRRGDWLARITGTEVSGPSGLDTAELRARWDGLRTADAVAALEALRACDPDGARAVTIDRWSGLPAELKERVLGSWSANLTDADEDFLEAALDERSTRVREAARRLLRQLPNSAHAQRMAQRLRPLVNLDRARLRPSHTRVTVLAPTTLDVDAARDGFPGTASAADRSRSLQLITSSAPLTVWTEATGLTPARIVEAVRADDALLTSLIAAAAAQRDVDWARALLAVRRDGALLATLPRADRDAYFLQQIPVEGETGLRELLSLIDRPWSPAIARTILDRVTRAVPNDAPKRPVRSPIHDASVFPAESIPHIRELLARAELPGADVAISDPLRRVLTAAVTYASFDQSIQEAFS